MTCWWGAPPWGCPVSSSKAVSKRDDAPEQVAPAEVARPSSVRLLRPVAVPAEILEAHRETSALIEKALKKDRDYGVIPGTGDKPTLLKPGAEKIVLSFGCRSEFVLDHCIEDPDRRVQWRKRSKEWYGPKGGRRFKWKESEGESIGFYEYRYTCRIFSRETGELLGEAVGVCSTMESKYVDRPRDSQNTAAKMAQKRALVAAVLMTFGLSDQFTQDVEEMRDVIEQRQAEEHGEAEVEEVPTADAVWPLGKYSGRTLDKLPSAFLVWGLDPARDFGTFTSEWQELFKAEIRRRGKEAGLSPAEIEEAINGRLEVHRTTPSDKPDAETTEKLHEPLDGEERKPGDPDNDDPESYEDMPEALKGSVDDDLPF